MQILASETSQPVFPGLYVTYSRGAVEKVVTSWCTKKNGILGLMKPLTLEWYFTSGTSERVCRGEEAEKQSVPGKSVLGI